MRFLRSMHEVGEHTSEAIAQPRAAACEALWHRVQAAPNHRGDLPRVRAGIRAATGARRARDSIRSVTGAPAHLRGAAETTGVESTIPSVSVAQMREIDRLMVDELGITLEQMMENAGRALAALARSALRDLQGRRIMVLTGPGGNGGGVLVAARRLAIWGAKVSVALASPVAQMHPVPAHQLAVAVGMGIEVLQPHAPLPDIARSAMVLDGVFGYSLAGAPRGRSAELIKAANESRVPILALDVPSGLSADTGEPFDPTIRAHQTLTLALPKVGLLCACARPYIGELFVADISVPAQLFARLGLTVGPLFASSDILRVSRSDP